MQLNLSPHCVIPCGIHSYHYAKQVKTYIENTLPIRQYMFSCCNVLENEFYIMFFTLKKHSIHYVKRIKTYIVNALPIQLYMFFFCNVLGNEFYSMLFSLQNMQITHALHIVCKQCLRDYMQCTIEYTCLK